MLTAGQWQQCFQAKQDVLGIAPATLGANTFTGTQTIAPTTGTINKGLAITQRFPSSGTPVGPILGNTIDVVNPGISAGGTGTWDAFGVKNLLYATRVTMSVTGASTGAGNSAFGSFVNVSAPSDGFGSATGVTVTGLTPDGHYMWGGISYAVGFVNSKSGALIGHEAEVGLGTGGTTTYRLGYAANSQGPVKGSLIDAAFSASVIGNVIPGSVGTSTPWEHLIALVSTIYGSGFPITTTGDFFYSETAGTVGSFANLSNITVTGNILSFPNMAIGGNGSAVFGLPAASLPAAGVIVGGTSKGNVQVIVNTNGAASYDGVSAQDSSTNNTAFFGVGEASNTTSRFGSVIGNWAELVSTGSSNLGLKIGTIGSLPLILGTNNTARLSISAAGDFTFNAASITGLSLPTTGLTGTLQAAQEPAHTGDVTNTAGSLAMTLATAQPAVHTWALAQTFTVPPVFTDASGTRTALGLGTMATQAASAVAITGGTINGTLGGTTPAAGTFTTVTGNTSVSSPIHASPGAHTFQSNGSTFAGSISTGQLWYLGSTSLTPAAGSTLTVSQNTGGTPGTSVVGNILLQQIAADAAIGVVSLDTFGNQGFFAARHAGGTQASKTATAGAANIYTFGAQGWDTSAYATGAALDFSSAASTWSASNHGMAARIRTTTDGTTSLTERFRVTDAGGINIGSTVAVLATSELGMNKISASGSAPGAGSCKIAAVAGTSGGTCKLIAYCGTSTTPANILDNIGTGC